MIRICKFVFVMDYGWKDGRKYMNEKDLKCMKEERKEIRVKRRKLKGGKTEGNA